MKYLEKEELKKIAKMLGIKVTNNMSKDLITESISVRLEKLEASENGMGCINL